MRTNGDEGWVEFLYKPVGRGLANLANRSLGDRISLLGPIGKGFDPVPDRPIILAIGGGVGIPPVFFLAELLNDQAQTEILVFMGSEVPFPFELRKSDEQIEGISAEISASVATLADWGVTSRLASNAGIPNCYKGYVPDLARLWLSALTEERITQVQVVACGPMPMLEATAALARDFSLPCQVAVEEYMACGVGGCAGCTILLHTSDGPAMKRVCVDGPVFAASEVFPEPS
jgi:dihydroorotate dehydrogenase electron transfer subunit